MAQYKVIRDFPNSWGIKKGTILQPYGMKSYNCVIVSEDKYNNMMTNIREPYKYPEIFEKVPETPNPKKGFDAISFKVKLNLLRSLDCSDKKESDKWIQIALSILENQANGETPEVDNPVPSMDDINRLLDDFDLEMCANHGSDRDYLVESLYNLLSQNGRETDKERL